jgi:serine/threonine protein kinase
MMQVELQSRRRLGEFPSVADYGVEFASWLPRIESLLTQRAVGASEEPDRTSPDGLALDGTASSTQSFIRPSSAAMLSDTGPLPMANRLLAPAAPDPVPASIGRYRIESRVGSGSFGTVYRALDPNLKRRVAIKVTHRHRIRQAEDIDQFRREAQILAQLDHPNIVPVYDADMLDDGRVYVVANAS